MTDAVITLNGLTKNFAGMEKPAVAPLDCTVHAGYVTGLVGPDGAGAGGFVKTRRRKCCGNWL